jgi:HAE1 family hydrophobic/amphiphilic exporter-1
MFLSIFSIRQPVTTVAIIIVLMCLGLLALFHLRVNQIPDVEMPVMVVTFPYPGASPESVERDIINRVEKSLQSIPQIYELNSTASDGQAQFVILFDFKKDMSQAGDEVRNAIAGVRYKLPLEMREPVLFRVDPSAQPIMNLGLSSERQSHVEISRLAEDVLADQLRGIDGVAVVNVDGSLQRQLSVLLHAQKLREYNVSAGDVVNALRAQNTNAPVGRVKGELDEQNIRLVGRIERPADFNDIVVKRQGNEVVRLGQVATVQDGFAEPSSYSLRTGKPNVGLSVIRQREASTVTVAERVRDKVDEINKTLPEGTKLEITKDGGKDAQDSLNNVIHALIFGAGLTIFVVYAFLNFLAFDADHRAVAAHLRGGRVHRRVAVRVHAEFHDPAGPVARHRRAHRRRHRGAREHRPAHGTRRGPRDRGPQRHRGDRSGGDRDHVLHRRGVRARGLHERRRR